MANEILASRSGATVFAEDWTRGLNQSNEIARKMQSSLSALSKTQTEIARSNREIEQYTARIAEATERLNITAERQLAEAEKQTAIQQQQLELSKIANLERQRQNEVKQCAYELNEALKSITAESDIQRFYDATVAKQIVASMQIYPESVTDIPDKEYIRDAVAKLNALYDELAAKLGANVTSDMDRYLANLREIDDIRTRLGSLNEDADVEEPANLTVQWLLLKAIYPVPWTETEATREKRIARMVQSAQKKGKSYDEEKWRANAAVSVKVAGVLGTIGWVFLLYLTKGLIIILSGAMAYSINRRAKQSYDAALAQNDSSRAESDRLLGVQRAIESELAAFHSKYGVLSIA